MRKRGGIWRICGMKYSWKGHKDRNRHKNRMKRSGQAGMIYVKRQHPHHVKVSPRRLWNHYPTLCVHVYVLTNLLPRNHYEEKNHVRWNACYKYADVIFVPQHGGESRGKSRQTTDEDKQKVRVRTLLFELDATTCTFSAELPLTSYERKWTVLKNKQTNKQTRKELRVCVCVHCS